MIIRSKYLSLALTLSVPITLVSVSLVVNVLPITQQVIVGVADPAEQILSNWYDKMNNHQFEAARELMTEDARNEETNQTEKLKNWTSDRGLMTPDNFRIRSGNSESKVFSYDVYYKGKTGESQSDPATGALIRINGIWKIQEIDQEYREFF